MYLPFYRVTLQSKSTFQQGLKTMKRRAPGSTWLAAEATQLQRHQSVALG